MPKSIQVEQIRAVLSKALDGVTGKTATTSGPLACGNIVNLKMPALPCSSGNCHCQSALRVTLALYCGFACAALVFAAALVTVRILL